MERERAILISWECIQERGTRRHKGSEMGPGCLADVNNRKLHDQSTLSKGSWEGLKQEDGDCLEKAGPTVMGNSLGFL